MPKPLLMAAALLLAGAGSAAAAAGAATGSVNLRTGPGTGYARIATIPAGARVEVLRCAGWCEVIHAGRRGWASARYIAWGPRVPPPGAYPVLPDRSLCHGPQVWSLPYCENPLERSIREFNHGNHMHQHRRR